MNKLICAFAGHKMEDALKFEYSYKRDSITVTVYSKTCSRCGYIELYYDVRLSIKTKNKNRHLGIISYSGTIKNLTSKDKSIHDRIFNYIDPVGSPASI